MRWTVGAIPTVLLVLCSHRRVDRWTDGTGLLSIVPIGQDSDSTDLTEIEFAADSLAKQTCVFRFLDNDYKEPSSKS